MKKYIALLGTLFITIVSGIVAGGIIVNNSSTGSFVNSGYILGEGNDDEKLLNFLEETAFSISQTGTVELKNESGTATTISSENFVHMTDDSIMALADGVLVDFADLSSNFINNYYISATLPITATGTAYTAATESGDIEFGDHLWKLSDNKYMIRSNSLSVYFSDEDIREVSGFIEVAITSDGIVQLLTEENEWFTISENCYIETESGVKINPVTQIIDDGTYKISIAKLVVTAEDNIVLTEDELRRQIVPEITIETVDGEDGEEGGSGTNGTDGNLGTDGAEGTSGESGGAGEDGATGSSGNSGVNGANGTKGLDSTVESSTNTALPTMTISEWKITETSLQASIEVGGGAEALEIASDAYDGYITITNVATGEVIACYETDSLYNIYDEAYTGINFRTAVGVSFSTKDNPLEPNTEYKLSVNAYYTLNDVIYSREFIGRTFYTDSTGLQIAHTDSTEASVTIDVSAVSALGDVQVYLLTAAQNESFTTSSISDASNFVDTTTLSFAGEDTQTYTFTGLSSNTEYVARAIVNGVISDQEVSMLTLKESPTWDTTIAYGVTANYNRVTGAYEIYRPEITDIDSGTVKYVYTAYKADGTVESSKTLYPGDVEPVTFYLTADTEYYFEVELYFYDNEKTVTYNVGTSEHITTEGTTLPKVTWKDDYDITSYNKVTGTIQIALTGNSQLKVSNSQELTVDIYADQVINKSITIKDENTTGAVAVDDYAITYTSQGNTNYAYVGVEFDNLLNNTNYTITLSGYIDLQDTNGYVKRELGTVSFRTLDTNTIAVTFSSADNTTNTISQNIVLTIQGDGDSDSADEAYVYEQLIQGRVTVELYKGTGSTKEPLGTSYYTDTDLENMYTKVADDGTTTAVSGVTITEDNFNLPNLDSDSSYTMVISEVVDDSYSISELGYQNAFDDITPSSKVITAVATPPDLLADPTMGVTSTPIYNSEATQFGAKYASDLPDDTIIGYRIESEYDNSQRLGKTVTYYLYEYTEFYNAVTTGNDPIVDGATTIREITLPISTSSDTVPMIAVFFDDVEFVSDPVEGTTTSGNYYIYKGGTTFTRGYRYIFAYTAEYTTNTSDGTAMTYTYPYARSDYSGYMNEYGCGQELGTTIGKGVAYILNSGMMSAPKASPEFYTYVYETDAVNGTVTVHYSYDDIDGTISTTGSVTQIKYIDANGGETFENIGGNQLTTGWFSITLPYSVKQNASEQTVLTPVVDIQDYVVDKSSLYDTILQTLSGQTYTEEPFYLTQIPVEFDYETLFNSTNYKNMVSVTMDTSYMDENYLVFTLGDVQTLNSGPREDLASRALAMRLTFSPTVTTGSDVPDSKIFYVGITTDTFSSKVIFSTAQLGNEYINKEFKVEAEVIYDTGSQGWSYLKTEDQQFALQRTNTIDNDVVTYEYGAYYVGANSLKYDMSGGLLQESSSTYDKDFIDYLRATNEGETYVRTVFSFLTSTTATLTRYFTLGHYGVLDNQSTDLKSPSSYYVIPKGVSTYTLSFSGGDTATLDTIVPTVGEISDNEAVDRIEIYSFEVTGHSEITETTSGTKEVTMYIYTNETSAMNNVESERVIKNDNSGEVASLTVTIDETTGKFTCDKTSGTDTYVIDGLNADTMYYIAYTAWVDTTSGSVETVLIDKDTAAQAVYEFYTIDGIQLTADQNGVYYRNDSYLEKALEFSFSLNEYIGVEVEYDIYNSSDITATGSSSYTINTDSNGVQATPALSYASMVANNILQVGSLYYSNNVTISLTPDEAREALVPGGTYYLVITADLSGSSDTSNQKQVMLPFTITSVGSVGALIYVDEATKDSLSFLVSIMDGQYSLMGDDSISDTNGAPYVVRFTDSNDKRIYTSYDSQVFYSGTVQQKFVLSEAYLTGASSGANIMKANTTYKMYVYSVYDDVHDGTSYPIATVAGDTTKLDITTEQEKEYFISTSNFASGVYFSNLINLVDSFWYTDGSNSGENRTNMDIVEDNYSIANRSQITTNSENLYINEDKAIITINASACFELILEESYGVVISDTDADGVTTTTQYFDEIRYTISGRDNTTLTGVDVTGSTTNADEMFALTSDSAGYAIFTYQIPESVSKGSYTITIQLWKAGVQEYAFSSNYYYN